MIRAAGALFGVASLALRGIDACPLDSGVPNGRSLYEAIVKQEVEIGVYIINEIVTTPGVELAGPLPPDLQFYMMYSAGIMPAARKPELARELIKFLSSPAALPIIRAKGMEPG